MTAHTQKVDAAKLLLLLGSTLCYDFCRPLCASSQCGWWIRTRTFFLRLDSISARCTFLKRLRSAVTSFRYRLKRRAWDKNSLFYCQGVSVVSLDKALELNQISARVGDNIEIKCDVTGSPTPPIVWRRHGLDLTQLTEDELKVFPDGALYINNVQLIHTGNYTCHAQRNKDVVQTHILHVHSKQKEEEKRRRKAWLSRSILPPRRTAPHIRSRKSRYK